MASLIAEEIYFETWSADDLKKFFALETVQGWGIFFRKTLISFIVFQSVGDEAEIIMLFVNKGHRQKGLATHLLQVASARLRAKKMRTIFLEVSTKNKVAIGFYERNGFRITGRRENYYSRPVPHAALIMTSLLRS